MEMNRPRLGSHFKPEAVPQVQMIYAPSKPCPPGEYRSYHSVPWHRRSGVNIFFVLIGLICPPLLWWAVGNSLTGRIYTPAKNDQGFMETWCPVSKFATIIVLVFQTALLVLAIPAFSSGRMTAEGPAADAVVADPQEAGGPDARAAVTPEDPTREAGTLPE
jgi:hypothetical protein